MSSKTTIASLKMVKIEFRAQKVIQRGLLVMILVISMITCIDSDAWLTGGGIGPTSEEGLAGAPLDRSRSQPTYAGIRKYDKQNAHSLAPNHTHDSKDPQQPKRTNPHSENKSSTIVTMYQVRTWKIGTISISKSPHSPTLKSWDTLDRDCPIPKRKMGRMDAITRACRVLGSLGLLDITRTSDINRSRGLGGGEIDDATHTDMEQIFSMSGEERATLAFEITDPARRAAHRSGPFSKYLNANKALYHQHMQISGIREISSMAGGSLKIAKATISLEPLSFSQTANRDPIDFGPGAPTQLPDKAKVKSLIDSFCNTIVPGLITSVHIHPDSFPLIRGKRPLSVYSAKLEVSKDAKEADIAKLMVATKKKDNLLCEASANRLRDKHHARHTQSNCNTHNITTNCNDDVPTLQMSGAIVNRAEKKGVPTRGAPLLEVVGKALSEDTIDSLSIEVSCSVSVVPGDQTRPITSYDKTESGVYNFAALVSDFTIALQTQKAALIALSAPAPEALDQWRDLQNLISQSDLPGDLTNKEHEEIRAGLKAAAEILMEETTSTGSVGGSEALDYGTSPVVTRSTQMVKLAPLGPG